ncbi:hypothetical protein [Agarilytica rhodophyticola]|uniref:hypothetical protein n=1 Tax=Agarilytica rhodophyticola TaxID=1737490 RepID=UPI000B346379|nr:hypothetical protein [Agarilytica rhodophyticola]
MESEINQFKSLVELRDYIKQFDGFRARPIRDGEHPTLYREDDTHNANTHGVRYRDYLFDVDGVWVLPHEQKGLSFSGTWKHLSSVYKMFSRGVERTPDVYWVLSGADLPPGLKFEQDRSSSSKAKGHYFLTVTERMHVSQLRQKLLWVADRMQKITSGGKVL